MYFNLTLCWCKDLKQTLFGYTLFCLECDGHRLRPVKILSCVKSTIAGCEGGYHPNILVVVRVVDLLFICNLFGLI